MWQHVHQWIRVDVQPDVPLFLWREVADGITQPFALARCPVCGVLGAIDDTRATKITEAA